MKEVILKAHGSVGGIAEGEALVTSNMMCFTFDVDVMTGVIHDPKSDMRGQTLADKVLVFPMSRGSSSSPYGLYLLSRAGNAPRAIIAAKIDPMSVAGAVLSNIPIVYNFEQNPMDVIKSGDIVRVDGNKGIVTVTKVTRADVE